MSNASIPSGYLKTSLKNGLGRYVCQLKRVTLRFCKEQHQSKGMRDFAENHMINFCQKNPSVAVYAQVRRHKAPYLVAEYLNGDTQKIGVSNKSHEEVMEWLDWLRTRTGFELYRIRKPQHTDSPSIQGTWTPFTNLPSSHNATVFPSDELSAARKFKVSATQRLQEVVDRHKKPVDTEL